MTIPSYLKDDDRARSVFRQVVRHLKEVGKLEKVDADMVAAYASAVSMYEKLTRDLNDKGLTITDHNGLERRRPEVIIRKQAFDQMKDASKVLGIDRSFREKGREKASSLGKSASKSGKLRKIRS